jgi:hypothetical protein
VVLYLGCAIKDGEVGESGPHFSFADTIVRSMLYDRREMSERGAKAG